MEEQIDKRKDSHLEICRTRKIEYDTGSGFYDITMVHNALPEMDREEADCSVEFLGKKLAAPIIISAMSGGTANGGELNRRLSGAAQKGGIAFALGSQRPMLKDPAKAEHFKVRKFAPDIPIIGNIGAAQLGEYPVKKIQDMVEMVEADALAVHLNALQEAIQPEGETKFKGVLERIDKLCAQLPVPVIVKETGAGISGPVARSLFEAGAKFVESSGSGGTSWSKVEYERGGHLPGFKEWGYPAVPAIAECALAGPTIATGGVRCGVSLAKGIALGAKMGGAALPFLQAEDPEKEVQQWIDQIRTTMFLTGSKDISQLQNAPLIVLGASAEIMRARGIDPAMYAMRSNRMEKNSKPGGKENHYF
ncbi:MAG: type 2 isopentenyl-diphosphate Delta-isomerase [Candidatus Micrarchaeota archaeon]